MTAAGYIAIALGMANAIGLLVIACHFGRRVSDLEKKGRR